MAANETRVLKTVKVSARRSVFTYIAEMWRYRHLCVHLASSDLRSRFRRSALGLLWALIHPLAFTMLYSIVLASFFKQEFRDFSVYVFAGFILWEAISSYIMAGSHSIINAAGYLKQSPIPMILFPIRTCLTITVMFMLAVVAFALYTQAMSTFFLRENGITLYWLWAAPVCAALFMFGVPLATIAAHLNLLYRDTQQLLIIGTQAVWFASPVFFAREVFEAPELRIWEAINPVVAFCDVFRDTLVYARMPDLRDWLVIGVWIVGAWIVAIATIAVNGRKAIFYT